MTKNHDPGGLVGAIYDAGLDHARWPMVLSALRSALEGEVAALFFRNSTVSMRFCELAAADGWTAVCWLRTIDIMEMSTLERPMLPHSRPVRSMSMIIRCHSTLSAIRRFFRTGFDHSALNTEWPQIFLRMALATVLLAFTKLSDGELLLGLYRAIRVLSAAYRSIVATSSADAPKLSSWRKDCK